MFLPSSAAGASATLIRCSSDGPRALLTRALGLATDVVATVGLDQLDNPTPCRDFDVRQILEHLVDVVERLGEIGRETGRGGDLTTRPAVVRYVHDEEWLPAFCDAAAEAIDAWADDAVLDSVVELPWSVGSGRTTLALYLNEVTVHTWDLARATGQHPAWDDDVVGLALDAVRALTEGARLTAFDAGGTTIGEEWDDAPDRPGEPPAPPVEPFGPAFELDTAAPLIDRLVAWNGRQP
jgi:uncharacterized protein (TIGR03086 family)